MRLNPLNAELNPICRLLALLGTHSILHVSRVRVNVTVEGLAPLHHIPEFPGSIFGHPRQHPFQFINLTPQPTYTKRMHLC
jgi:hypothetical protein